MSNIHWSEDEVDSFFELCGDERRPDWESIVDELNRLYHDGYKVRTVNSARHKYRLKKDKWVAKLPDVHVDPVRAVAKKDREQYLTKELKASRRKRAFEEELLATIIGCAPAFITPPPMREVSRETDEKTPTTLIANFADHHVNRVIIARAVEFLNEYGIDIYARRLWSIIKGLIHIAQAQYTMYNQITELVLNLLGDMANDTHRKSNHLTNEKPETVACIIAAHIIAQGMDALLRAKTPDRKHYLFSKISMNAVPGNEGRIDEKINWQQPERNWDWLIYQWIAASLRDAGGRVTYNITESYMDVIDVMGHHFLIDHGLDIRSWAGISYYGMKRSNAKQQFLRKARGGFDYRITGHIHVKAQLPEFCRSHFVCPSIVGVDGFAHNANALTGDIGQLLLAVTEKRGVISEHLVYADDDEESPFVYDMEMAVDGAYKAMEAWRKKDIGGID